MKTKNLKVVKCKPQQVVGEHIVVGMRDYIRKIRCGELTDIAIVVRNRDGEIITGYSTGNFPGLLGGIELLKKRLLVAWDDEAT